MMSPASPSGRVQLLMAGSLLALLTGCATSSQMGQPGYASNSASPIPDIFNSPNACSNNSRNIGILAGAVGGAILGHFIGNNAIGVVLGGTAGAAAGGLIGHSVDVRRCNLYHIAVANQIRIAAADITPGKLGISSSGQPSKLGLDVQVPDASNAFEPGTADLTPHARYYFSQIASQYRGEGQPRTVDGYGPPPSVNQKILIVGHTSSDEREGGVQGAELSERRARAVSKVFAQNGVPAADIYYQGAGDAVPIASSSTPEGAADNSRIQIVSVPSTAYLKRYLNRRSADPELLASKRRPEAGQLSPLNAPKPLKTVVADGYGFEGQPTRYGVPIELGPVASHSMFPGIASAEASQPANLTACISSTPHPTTQVKNLESGAVLETAEDLPGFYGAPWTGRAGKSLVALLHVYAAKDTAVPVPRPDFRIYKNYFAGNKAHAAFSELSTASVYRGGNAVLYRVFVGGPVQCLDLVIPRGASTGIGHLYYKRGETTYETSAKFSLAR